MKRFLSLFIVLCIVAVGFISTGICAESAEASSTSTSISNGVYFIKDTNTSKFVDVKNKSVADGRLVQQWGFHGGNTQKWVISKRVDGYYTIRVYGSTVSYYLSVKDDSTASNASIVLKKGTSITDGMLWKITYFGGTYTLKPKTSEGTYYVLGLQNSSSYDDGVQLRQKSIDNYSNWELIKTSSSALVPILEPGHYHGDIMDAVGTILSSNDMGYTPIRRKTNATVQQCIEAMETSSVFFSRSHGKQKWIEVKGGNVTTTAIYNLPDGALSNCKLVFYGACLTGKGGLGADNLVNKTHEKGARAVVGFTIKVNCQEANLWSIYFFRYMKKGYTVERAAERATKLLKDSGKAVTITSKKCYYIAGAKGMRL